MNKHAHRTHAGITVLEFSTSLGTAIEGLSYRLNNGQGSAWAGVTEVGGKGVAIGSEGENQSSESYWLLTDGSVINIEVQRDDGTWKLIGGFVYDIAVRKQIRVTAGAVAIPLQMDRA